MQIALSALYRPAATRGRGFAAHAEAERVRRKRRVSASWFAVCLKRIKWTQWVLCTMFLTRKSIRWTTPPLRAGLPASWTILASQRC